MPIHHGLSETEYNALPGLRSSAIRAVRDNPAKYRHAQDNPPAKPAKHFTLGSAVHAFVLEDGKNVVRCDTDDWKITKANADARALRDEAHAEGKYPMNNKEYALALAIADSLRANRHVKRMLATAQRELTITGADLATFTPLKARLDLIDVETRTIMDPKTCASAAPDDFPSHALRYGYHIQDVQYVDLVAQATDTKPDEWRFLFALVEKDAPHLSRVTELDPDFIRRGWKDRREGITRYLECQRTGVWPGYPDEITSTPLPRWAHAA